MEGNVPLSSMEVGGNRQRYLVPVETESRAQSSSFWSRRTLLEKILMAFSCVAALACVAVGIAFATGMQVDASSLIPSSHTPYAICTTPECTVAAADLIEAMDPTADPCENFFQFACGGWIGGNPIPSDSSRWNQFNVLRDELKIAMASILSEQVNSEDPLPVNQVKDVYTACMNETQLENIGLTPLTDLLATYGTWPITNPSWDPAGFDWQFVVADGRRTRAVGYLFNVFVFADEMNTAQTTIYIDQTTLGMPRSVLTDPSSYTERFAAYDTYIETTAQLIATSLGNVMNSSVVEIYADDVISFEMALANITTPSEDRREVARLYNPMNVTDLQAMTAGSSINWLTMLNNMFSSVGIAITDSTRVIVMETEYVKKAAALIDSTNPLILSNYLLWRHVMSLGDETTKAMRDASFQYQMVASGVSTAEPRNEVCSNKANNYMGFAIGLKYVESYFSEKAKNDTELMVADIKRAFDDLLVANEWMDNTTKPLAMEKAQAMTEFIGYPDWYKDPNGLSNYYAGLTGITRDQHFANILTLSLWSSSDELDDYGQPTDKSKWLSPPTIVNAFYMPEYNSITFPAGILQSPFYRANTLQMLNYGGIGQVIGHEITHGFDDQGSQYDKNGNAIPWWTNETLIAFEDKAQCIIDQYSSYRVPEIDTFIPNATVNGVTTQGENIADNGGLRAAYLAYLKYVDRNGEEPRLPGIEQYTPYQVFFLSNANIWCGSSTTEALLNQVLTDPHSPEKFRVIGPMSNMKEFSDHWGCPLGSSMNPLKKCIVW